MSAPLGTPARWRERAAEAREKAKYVADPGVKRVLLRIAENFEKFAMQVEGITAGTASLPRKD